LVVCSIRDGKLYDYNLRRTVEDFTAFAEGAYAKVEAKELPAGALSPALSSSSSRWWWLPGWLAGGGAAASSQ
jgi:hypothetical protein